MLGCDALHTCVSGNVAYQRWLVIHQVLPQTRVGPEQVLKACVVRPIVRIRDQYGSLNVVTEVSSWLDFSKSVMKCSRSGQVPQCVDKVVGISLDASSTVDADLAVDVYPLPRPAPGILGLQLVDLPRVGCSSPAVGRMSM